MDKIETFGVVPIFKGHKIKGKDGIDIHHDFCGSEDDIPADVRCDFLEREELESAFI